MFWKFNKARQRLLLYFAAIWVIGMAYVIGDMASRHPPRYLLLKHPALPWETICQVGVYLIFGIIATELILLLVQRLRSTNEHLEQQKSVFESFTTHNPFGVLTFDTEGKLLSCNKSAATIFGAPLPDTYSLTCDEVFQKAKVLRKIKDVFSGRVVHLSEVLYNTQLLEHVHLPPRQITFRAVFFPILDNQQQVISIVAIYEDITEKVKLERQLTRAQRMESIGTLAGGIAHDFNNILGGVLGNISLLKPKVPTESPLQRYIETIESSVRRAAQLTRQLLTFVRGDFIELKAVRINDCIENVVRLVDSSFDKKYRIEKSLEENALTVECDAGQIEQALLNLCLNARDAMLGGGRITLSSRNLFIKEKGRTEGIPPDLDVGAYVVLAVSDTGTGMDENTQKRIFEPFFTTKAPGKGTGLGLAMVFGIMKNHGALVDLQSELGQGTTFYLYLKASLKTTVEAPRNEEKTASGGKECILLVDDEDVIREFAAETLQEKGYFVITAEDGAKAIELFKNRPCEIDVVISDMVMPNASGRQVFAAIKKMQPEIKFVFSSGYNDSDVLQDAIKQGQVQFIQKPYTGDELCKLIRKVMDTKTPDAGSKSAPAPAKARLDPLVMAGNGSIH
ncbi:MAG: PAS domain-containing sensor histidine kinase [Verrucomicrobiae bacterium]|nr:PAS domain-containing sensor histidine kinase [Verrucomicrobiae bacterium]